MKAIICTHSSAPFTPAAPILGPGIVGLVVAVGMSVTSSGPR